MALSDYTTADEVRAALGVSSNEISDEVLGLPMYEDNLVLALEDQGSSLIEDLQTVQGISSGLSRTQDSFLRAARLFCTYTVAHHLTTVLPLFSPQSVTDGKAGFNRFAVNPYRDIADRVEDMLGSYTTRLRESYAALNSTSAKAFTRVTLMAVSSPSSDPVTGS